MEHPQAWVKVNVHVDEGVASLVEALNGFPGLQTVESCQKGENEPVWVCFLYGSDNERRERPWQGIAEFTLGVLGTGLSQRGVNARTAVYVTGSGLVLGEIEVRREDLPSVEKAIQHLAGELQDYPRP